MICFVVMQVLAKQHGMLSFLQLLKFSTSDAINARSHCCSSAVATSFVTGIHRVSVSVNSVQKLDLQTYQIENSIGFGGE